MGEVWVARHAVTGRHVALKILDRGSDEGIAERFRREAAVTAELGHPGIVEVLDAGFGEGDHSFYIAMELLDGCTLEERMADPLASPEEILSLIDATLVPLAAAHDRRVIHRDLKPANVFVTSGGTTPVKLLDFGIARNDRAEGMTMTGTSMGTPSYMSPEQALDSRRVTPATDVWSVGVMLYEALCGERPFSGQTTHGVIVAACTEPHLSLHEVVPGIDPALSRLVDRCLSKNPLERPRNAQALRDELAPFVTRAPTMSMVPDTASLRPRVSRPPVVRTVVPWAWGLLSLGAVATGVGTTLIATGGPGVIPLLSGLALVAAGLLGVRRRPAVERKVSERPGPRRRPDAVQSPAIGCEHPSVSLLAFVDLAEATSRRLIRDLRELVDAYPHDLRVTLKCLPGGSDVSMRVAEAAHEAFGQCGDEGFWGLVELLQRSKRPPSAQRLEAHAETLGIHRHGLRHALRIERHHEAISRDRDLALALGITDGPAILLDGVRIHDLNRSALCATLERALGRVVSARPSHNDTIPRRPQAPMGLRYIVVQWRGVDTARPDVRRSKAAALERARSIQRRASLPESDFGLLAQRFGDKSHDLGMIRVADADRWVRKAASGLGEGQVAEPFETKGGYVVLKRYR